MRDRPSPKLAAAAAIAVPLLLILTLHNCSPAPEEPIEVGVLAPLTGSLAVWGVNTERGVRLAADRINAAGGIDGRQVRLLVEDSECRPATAVAALRNWASRGVPVVVGAICSADVLAMAPIAERSRVVILSTGASNPAISDAGEFIFRNWPSDRIQGELTADHAFERGLRNVAILYVDNAYGQGLEAVFGEHFRELGGAIALSPSETYAEGDDDFRAQLARIADSGADALYLPAYTREYPAILAQARELGLGVPIIASETFDDPGTIERSGAAAEGVTFPSPASFDRTTPQGRELVEGFESAYGEPPGITSDTAFDAMNILARAFAAGARTGPEIRDFLNRLEGYQGVAGVVDFDSNGDAQKETHFYSVSGGVAVPRSNPAPHDS
jgi:branched-chain amino acid transport system substrate-binding protein